ncbi:MAG: O-antigen ligase family protein [Candidatus Kapabacteria bacterium]|nr:O-antigen ligase family protein [Candidatus Kapabacteria bacterium]
MKTPYFTFKGSTFYFNKMNLSPNQLSLSAFSTLTPRIWEIPLYVIAFLALAIGAIHLQLELFALAAILGIPLVYGFFINPRFWIYFATLLAIPWFRDLSEETTPFEVITALFYVGSLAVWFISRIFFLKRKIVSTVIDGVLLTAILLTFVSFILGFFFNVDTTLKEILSEWLVLFFLLYAFPIKELFKTEKQIMTLLAFWLTVSLGISGFSIYKYTKTTSLAVYAWQIVSARNALNELVYVFGCIISILGIALFENRRVKMFLFCIFVVVFAALVSTFTRGYWLGFIIAFTATFFFLPKKNKILITVISLCTVIVLGSGIFLFFQEKALTALTMVGKRFTSSSKASQDLSILVRVKESGLLLNRISESPLGGYGLGAKYHYYDMIEKHTVYYTFAHNGYLYAAFKFGIPHALLIYFPFFSSVLIGFYVARKTKNTYTMYFALVSAGTLLAMLSISMTANQISMREGNYIGGVCIGIAIISYLRYKEEQKELGMIT